MDNRKPRRLSEKERETRKMRFPRLAMTDPGVRHYGDLIAASRLLAREMNRWLEENPRDELNQTSLAMNVVFRDDSYLYDNTAHHYRAIESMAWFLEKGVESVIDDLDPHGFASCHEPFQSASKQNRKPTQKPRRKTTCKPVNNSLALTA